MIPGLEGHIIDAAVRLLRNEDGGDQPNLEYHRAIGDMTTELLGLPETQRAQTLDFLYALSRLP